MKRLLVGLLLIGMAGCGGKPNVPHPDSENWMQFLDVFDFFETDDTRSRDNGIQAVDIRIWHFSTKKPLILRLRVYRDGKVVHEKTVGQAMTKLCDEWVKEQMVGFSLDSPDTTVSTNGVLLFKDPFREMFGPSKQLGDLTEPSNFVQLSLTGRMLFERSGSTTFKSYREKITIKASDVYTADEIEQSAKGLLRFLATDSTATGDSAHLNEPMQQPEILDSARWEIFEKDNSSQRKRVYRFELTLESLNSWQAPAPNNNE